MPLSPLPSHLSPSPSQPASYCKVVFADACTFARQHTLSRACQCVLVSAYAAAHQNSFRFREEKREASVDMQNANTQDERECCMYSADLVLLTASHLPFSSVLPSPAFSFHSLTLPAFMLLFPSFSPLFAARLPAAALNQSTRQSLLPHVNAYVF